VTSWSLVTVNVTFLDKSPADFSQSKFGGFFAGPDPLAFFPAVIPPFYPVKPPSTLQTPPTAAAGFTTVWVALTAMFFFSPFASRDYPPAFNQNCHL